MAAPADTTSAAGTTIEERASKMLAGIVTTDDLAPRVRTLLRCILETLVKSADRIAALEQAQRPGPLEVRRLMAFEGAHDPSREYRAGDVVQRANAAWVCIVATNETPGASQAWRRIGGDK